MSGEASAPDRLLEATHPALSLDELLPALASCWRAQSAAGVAVVGVSGADDDRVAAYRADASAATALIVGAAAGGASDEGALQQRLSAAANTGEAALWVPLADSDSVVGGILLYSDRSRALIPVPPAWIPWSARLAVRAREYEHRLRRDKLEALAQFAAGAGHEINNPLGSIIMSAEKLLREETDPERRRLLSTIGGEAWRARDMISDAMTFARPPTPQPVKLDLAEQIDDVLGRFAGEFHARRIAVETELSRPAPVHADRTQIAVVISELLRNSLNAVGDTGRIRIECRSIDAGDARFTVTDDGCGLNDEQRAHLFDPFYSGRQAGRGLGFGLSKAWRIVTNHGGGITVAENEPRGLTFTVRWPSGGDAVTNSVDSGSQSGS